MASLQDEFPDLTQKVFDALRPIADIAHGDSSQVVASVVLSSVRSAFVVLLQQDLIYSADEAKAVVASVAEVPAAPEPWVAGLSDAATPVSVALGVSETDLGPVTAEVDAGSVSEPVTEAADLGSVADPVPALPPSVAIPPLPEAAEAPPPSDQAEQPAPTPEGLS